MNNDKDHLTATNPISNVADRQATVGVLIGIGAGLGTVVGILFGNLVSGMMYGAGIGTLVGAVYALWRQRGTVTSNGKLLQSNRQSQHGGVGIAIGIMLGTAVGVATHNLAIGLAFGLMLGAALEALRQHPVDETPLLATRQPTRPSSLRWLLGCLAVLSVSAAFGGIVLVLNPTGTWLQIPLSILQFSPFRDFLIPGLILGIVFGVGSFATVLAVWFRPDWSFATALTRFTGAHWSWSAVVAIGLGQVIWIVTEMLMVRGADWLQFVYGSLGLLIVFLSFQPGTRRYLALGTTSRRD